MLSRFTKASLRALPQGLTYTIKPSVASLRQLSPLSSQINPTIYTRDTFDLIFSNDSRSDVYIRDLYKYMATASVIGVSSALVASSAIPLGLYSAGLALAGIGLDRLGMDYIRKTKAEVYKVKSEEGDLYFEAQNTPLRKLAFVSSCLGYGCIIGSLAATVPVTSSVLGVSAVTCLFSTLGQLTYSKFTKKEDAKPMEIFLSGMLAGVVGLNLIGSFSSILMLANPLILASTQMNTYVGLLLYNALTGKRSQKAMEDVENGKDDHLKHASKFSENWLYSLAPHFVMKLF